MIDHVVVRKTPDVVDRVWPVLRLDMVRKSGYGSRPMGVRLRRSAGVAGTVVLLVLVLGSLGACASSPGQGLPSSEASAPLASASPTSLESQTASPIPTAAYYDGIPTTWEGQPVLRGQAALDAAAASTDRAPFYVAFWAGVGWDRSCPSAQSEEEGAFTCGGCRT